jgi:hypothetical protein
MKKKPAAAKTAASRQSDSRKLDLPTAAIAAWLDEMRARFERGDGTALFSAIRFCANQELIFPEWVAAGFFAATNRWYTLECKTLDEAFGVKWPKGLHLAAARKRRRLEGAVWLEVTRRRNQDASVNNELFRDVGKAHGIGKTLAEEYYRSFDAKMAGMPSSLDILLEPAMTPGAKLARSTRKITKLRGTRSESR